MDFKFTSTVLVLLTIFSYSCGSESGNNSFELVTSKITADGKSQVVPVIIFGTKEWVLTDLSTTSETIPIQIKLPKEAKPTKAGNGSVEIELHPSCILTISNFGNFSSISEALASFKASNLNDTSFYKNIRILMEEPNGFVYTVQMKNESFASKSEPEYHFVWCIQKGETIYLIKDTRPVNNPFLPGSNYPEQNAKTLFENAKETAR